MSGTQAAGGSSAEKRTEAPASKRKWNLNLPATSFAMKANLVQAEPQSMERWQRTRVPERLREARAGAQRYVFHDGPPYANAGLHLGHILNKALKDFVVRSRSMAGLDCPYVPGWDCHGLPIEHKVMTDLLAGGKEAKLASLEPNQRVMAVRRECQKYAEKSIALQAGQMQRLLTLALYDEPYKTMTPAYEAAVLEVLADLLEQGLVYRAIKPVHWSIANETALAEAELEYFDREDRSVYVDLEALDAGAVYDAFGLPRDDEAESGAEGSEADDGSAEGDDDAEPARPEQTPCFMVWTTTPWTLPANVAVAVNPDLDYALVRMDGNVTIVAAGAVERVAGIGRTEDVRVLATTPGSRLLGLRYRHPFVSTVPACGLGHRCDPERVWSVVGASYVTLEDGTGLVHTAPGHGTEDYATGLREGLPVYCPVQGDGTYDGTAPDWLRGKSIWEANTLVTDFLRSSGHLFHDHTFTHSYPHDWRSKTPVIFRCTEQWFVGVDRPTRHGEGSLRDRCLAWVGEGVEGERVRFVPEWGRNRMRGMLESRPDWCISRQRAWGLPIPALFSKDGRVLFTPASVRAVAARVREKGSDCWFTESPAQLLTHYDPAADPDAPPGLRPDALHTGGDILDVWFESGSSWNAVMRQRGLGYPIDLYLEGSDQHRGWFQLSLLPAVAATGRPPFRTVLTHGFMVDKEGKKLSKSKGHSVEDLFKLFGADVVRWWVSSLSYENDIKVDDAFFNVAGESYRKVRNTLRFMLSNLSDFTAGADGDAAVNVDRASIDAWALAETDRAVGRILEAYQTFDFREAHDAAYDLCNHTLSAVYLAAVKDRLYCDRPDSERRRRTQSALWRITESLCRALAPILPHTADEAWRALHRCTPDDDRSVHLQTFLPPAGGSPSPAWAPALEMRDRVMVALDRAKKELGVENPLDAGIAVPDPEGIFTSLDARDLADLFGVSRVTLDSSAEDVRVIDLRDQPRCARSWKRDGTVRDRTIDDETVPLSDRDAEAEGVA